MTVSRHSRGIAKAKKLEKWVPRELNGNPKNRRYEACGSLLQRHSVELWDRIVTGGEKWIMYDNRR